MNLLLSQPGCGFVVIVEREQEFYALNLLCSAAGNEPDCNVNAMELEIWNHRHILQLE